MKYTYIEHCRSPIQVLNTPYSEAIFEREVSDQCQDKPSSISPLFPARSDLSLYSLPGLLTWQAEEKIFQGKARPSLASGNNFLHCDNSLNTKFP